MPSPAVWRRAGENGHETGRLAGANEPQWHDDGQLDAHHGGTPYFHVFFSYFVIIYYCTIMCVT